MKKSSHRVLLVDDDPDIGEMIRIILEYDGYLVEVTERGETAESLMRKQQYDVLIMDMFLSGLNGAEICARLKEDKTLSTIPILMISAHPNAKELCLNAGANDFIAKPFDMDELLAKVSRLVSAA
jgi:DNA-binding response OmpR family regulator